jgi:hypothetical protein
MLCIGKFIFNINTIMKIKSLLRNRFQILIETLTNQTLFIIFRSNFIFV